MNVPPTDITNASNSQIKRIDQEILDHEDAIRELRSRRNLLMPVSRLPVEVLCAIFMCVPDKSRYYRWHWITVTHTCRLFRTIALNCPALWSTPDFTKPKLAYEMIKRSKMAPLTIQVIPEYPLTPRVVDAVSVGLKQLPRINKIHLLASGDNMYKLLSGVHDPAPFLRTLILDSIHTRVESYVLRPDFLGGDAPQLTHVDLSSCHLSWDSCFLRNLIYLRMHYPGPPVPTLGQFIIALTGMPQLQVLDLDCALPDSTYTRTDEKSYVDLPCLRKLYIAGTLSECAIFITHVYIPPSATVHIKAICEQPEKDSVTPGLINQVCRWLTVSRDTTKTTIRSDAGIPLIKGLLVEMSKFELVIEAWGSESIANPTTMCHPASTHRSATNSGSLKLELNWSRTVTSQLYNELVVAVCSLLPLRQLRNLLVKNEYPVDSLTFVKAFGLLPNVHTVTIVSDSAKEVIEALNPAPTVPISTDSSSATLP
ncbi:hypothetical protein BT96DRAFT_977537 [Gymnopus androsaceus JB14]|uniref:F-box domain-containing protein n=1 Tax=Gymnopus androsaceus JB14 TaxID=1447944 RepID=A0A6A4HES8_9AGAR|nr:hypothetical protein BT96DRAFT_977537 [Gymnopus androsaceus JB14]